MAQPTDRRTFLGQGARTAAGLAVVGATGSALAACSAATQNASTTTLNLGTEPNAGVGTGKPVMGGSLIFGTEAEETGFDPTYAHYDSTGVLYARTVFDPLAIVLPDGTVVPYLAESITHNADYTAWTITLRPNLFFHDGNPCDGAALVSNMKAYLNSPLVNFSLTYVDASRVEPSGTLGVTLNMKQPWVPFDRWLAGYIGGQIAYVFSPAQYAKPGVAPGTTLLNSHPIGTGPFVFKEWVSGSHFTATRNPNYWRKDKYGNQLPYLDSITYMPLPIVSDRSQGLQTGSLDIIHTDDPTTILTIRGEAPNLTAVYDTDSPVEHDMDFAMINTTMAPFDDIRMRQAFAYGFNQTSYLQTSGLGVEGPSEGPFTKTSKYYAPTGFPTYNVTKARDLVQAYLTEHNLTSLQLIYGTTNTPQALDTAALVQGYITAIDPALSVKVEQVEQSEYITDAILGVYHVFAWRQFANIDPDLNYVFWSSQVPNGGVSVNFTRLKDNNVQTAIDKGRQTTDEATRIAAYQEVGRLFGTDCPYIWAAEDVWCIGAQKAVQNYNAPTTPTGAKALGMLSGIIWPTEIWKTA